MGCSSGDGECSEDEKPAHDVEITRGFWLGRTTVTVNAWERYRTALKNMTWKQAREFCEWSEGRLPTEAEWEYAARAGNPNARYAEADAIAWYGDNSGAQRLGSVRLFQADPTKYPKRIIDNGGGPHPVAQKHPNAWNLYDMLGNVLQWTADWYDERYYSLLVTQNRLGPHKGQVHTLRGDSWFSNPKNIRVSFRFGDEPVYQYGYVGFRCQNQLPQ